MVNPIYTEPDPEPDTEPDIRGYSQNNSNQVNRGTTSSTTQEPLENNPLSFVGSEKPNNSLVPIITRDATINEKDYAAPGTASTGLGTMETALNPSPTGQDHTSIYSSHHDDEEDEEPAFPHISWKQSAINTVKGCPIICAAPILLPIAWALANTGQSDVVVFVACLLSVLPLAGGLAFATEEVALRLGEAWGGLLNATFGNVIELLIAIIALVKGDIDIVQASMIGSILSNILLVLGMSYFAGGLRFHEQLYALAGAQMHISLLGLSIAAIVLPAAFHYAYPMTTTVVNNARRQGVPTGTELDDLLAMSRGLSFILLAAYGMFLTFQLWTHAYLFRMPKQKQMHPLPDGPMPHNASVFPRPNWVPSMGSSSSGSSTTSSNNSNSGPMRRLRRWSIRSASKDEANVTDVSAGPPTPPRVPSPIPEAPAQPYVLDLERQAQLPPHVRFVPAGGPADNAEARRIIRAPTGDEPKVRFLWAMGMLVAMAALAGVTAEYLVSSIDGLTQQTNVSREFVGLILLPVIGNAVEHVTAVTVSVKDKLNLSMSIAVGSSIQISLCILPILVLIGWAIGQPMMLFFDTFETITLVIAILIVNFAISDGRTNYLEGFCMMMAWVSIALVTWYYDPVY